MKMRIVEFAEDRTPQVAAFNERLRRGGIATQFRSSHIPAKLPKLPGRRLFEEYFLATDQEDATRGAYLLKHQDFWIGGRTLSIADFALPISEGIVNQAYVPVGPRLVLDAIQRQPLLFGLGMGGWQEPLVRLLTIMKWHVAAVPFFFEVIRPYRFLRNIQYLRRSVPRRLLLDAAAFSGMGWLGAKTAHWLRRRKTMADSQVTVESVGAFDDWADDLWERARPSYGFCAVRDAETLRILYPAEEKKFIRIRVFRRGVLVGWAVLLATDLKQHKHFGEMRLGSIVDCMACPQDAGDVVASAREVLVASKVDLIVSNQSHAAWCSALADAGFLQGSSNFLLATSPKLTEMLGSSEVNVELGACHFNRGDGDGPINL